MLHIAHCYILKSFLGLRNGNAFTAAETGEPSISSQNTLECTKLHIKLKFFFRGNTTGPPSTGGSAPSPPRREGREGKGGMARKGRGGRREAREGGVGKGDKFWRFTFQTKVTPLVVGTTPELHRAQLPMSCL